MHAHRDATFWIGIALVRPWVPRKLSNRCVARTAIERANEPRDFIVLRGARNRRPLRLESSEHRFFVALRQKRRTRDVRNRFDIALGFEGHAHNRREGTERHRTTMPRYANSLVSGARLYNLPMQKRTVLVTLALSTVIFVACMGDDPAITQSAPKGAIDAAATNGDAGVNSEAATEADAADGATFLDADGANPVYDVRSLPGLRLWLESSKELVAEAGNSTGFGTWTDSSGRWDGGAGSPDGGRHVAVPHNVNPPSIVANAFGGRATVSFTSGNGYIRLDNHDDWEFGLGDFVIVSVAKVSSGNGPFWILRPQATAGSEAAFNATGLCVSYGLGVTNGCTSPAYVPDTSAHIYVARRKGDIFSFRVDGTEQGTLDRSSDPVDIRVNLFAQPYVFIGDTSTMQVSEVIVVVGPTVDGKLTELETELKAKYGLL